MIHDQLIAAKRTCSCACGLAHREAGGRVNLAVRNLPMANGVSGHAEKAALGELTCGDDVRREDSVGDFDENQATRPTRRRGVGGFFVRRLNAPANGGKGDCLAKSKSCTPTCNDGYVRKGGKKTSCKSAGPQCGRVRKRSPGEMPSSGENDMSASSSRRRRIVSGEFEEKLCRRIVVVDGEMK